MAKKGNNIVQSIDRALDILEVLATGEGCRLTDLSQRLGLHKSTTHRLLSSLVHRRFVEQDSETGKYRLGIRIFELGSAIFNKMEIRVEAKAFLQELMQRTLETVHLVTLVDGEAIYIDKVESPQTIRMYSEIGKRTPLYCTAVGKVLLAYLPEQEASKILKGLELVRHTPTTITSHDELRKHLQMVKAQGYAVDDAEHEDNIRCIAGPIFNYAGKVVAAFSVSGPTMRMTRERVQELIPLIKEMSERISHRLGYNPQPSG